MIRFHVAKLMADRGFAERRRIEIGEVSAATGIHRSTISRVINQPGANVTADNMSRLCRYFGCTLSELAEYVDDEPMVAKPKDTAMEGPRPRRKRPATKG
jgi:putative transcriptional regulator